MELLLLGTAAADGWPAAYCDCPVCEHARRTRGPNLRMRSGALIDDDLKIDHSPDTIVHMMQAGRSLAKVRTILFTHEHPDHLTAAELKRTVNVAKGQPDHPIALYGNQQVLAKIRQQWSDVKPFRLDLRPLRPFEPITLPEGNTTVLPLPATHCEGALLLRITRGGRTLFYGHDSGRYKPETLAALGDGVPLDVALLDCTHTTRTDIQSMHHMNVLALLEMVEELRRHGAVVPSTRLIATHFSPHSGAFSHEDIVRAMLPHGVEVAFDGMNVRS
jgi:phosphoribosyl 1,2-cyclic phosphate phosphodiesterase